MNPGAPHTTRTRQAHLFRKHRGEARRKRLFFVEEEICIETFQVE